MSKIPSIKKPTVDQDIALNRLMDQALKRPDPTAVTADGQVIEAPAKQNEPIETPSTGHDLPWEDANERIVAYFQIRMPEPLKLKIEWLGSRRIGGTKESQHQIALKALEREIDRMVAKELKGR